MAMRKKPKHVAEVNMSSMTDIIFMLLIFFMMTSTLVKMVPYKLPESDSRAKAPIKITVEVHKDGQFKINEQIATEENMESILRDEVKKKGVVPKKTTVTIMPEIGTTTEQWSVPMKIANKIGAKAILGTEPHQ